MFRLTNGLFNTANYGGHSIRRCMRTLCILLILYQSVVCNMSNAQSVDELKNLADKKNAQAAAIDAQTAVIVSSKKLSDAKSALAAAELQNTDAINAATAATALAQAKTAQTVAESAATKASFDVPSSGITGTVVAATGATGLETALLAARATGLAAQKIVDMIGANAKDKNVYVFSPGEVPDFQALTAFKLQQSAVASALKEAERLRPPAGTGSGTPNNGPSAESVGTIGIALEAATKLLSFFKSDFTVAGSDVAADNQLLQQAFAGRMIKQKGAKVYLYSLYFPVKAGTGIENLPGITEIAASRSKTLDALRQLENYAAMQAKNKPALANPPSSNQKGSADTLAKSNEANIDKAKAALAAYDALLVRLYAADGSGAIIVRQNAVLTALADPASILVIMKLHKAGGSSYIEKNLWTSFGAMPYKVAGGVVASFSAFNAENGQVLASDTIDAYGGYVKVNGFDKLANKE